MKIESAVVVKNAFRIAIKSIIDRENRVKKVESEKKEMETTNWVTKKKVDTSSVIGKYMMK